MRRKKERRKFRVKQPDDAGVIKDGPPEDLMSEDDTQSEEVNTKNVQQVQDVTSDSRKPSKRRKVASTVPEENVTTNNDGLDNADSPLDPNHYPTLPIFPPPAIPNAPSKSTLALQGLDKALIDAEFIDPDVTRPIPLDETGDNSTHLSEKMRRRLHGLGITELFAGELFSSAPETNLN